jgi:hypothetical protein
MYFGGKAAPSVLQTVPEEKEHHPLYAITYPQSTDFNHYTVECWVKCDNIAEDSTIIERAVRSSVSNPGDQRFVRCNFQLAVKRGAWYTKFDTDGTVSANYVEVYGAAATTEWTHLAATYDAKSLKLYVNGLFAGETVSSYNPEYGKSALFFTDVSNFWGARDYPLVATIIGASVKSAAGDNGRYGAALAVTSSGAVGMKNLSAYEKFFEGFIDEVRVWDGARTSDEIADAGGSPSKANVPPSFTQTAPRQAMPAGNTALPPEISSAESEVSAEVNVLVPFPERTSLPPFVPLVNFCAAAMS